MGTKINKEAKYENDWRSYRQFVEEWEKGILSALNPVYQIVHQSSWTICRKYNCEVDAAWVAQICLIALARGEYERDSSLEAYISVRIFDELKRREQEHVREAETDNIFSDERPTAHIEEEVFRRMASEPHMGALLEAHPYLERKISNIIIIFEKRRTLNKRRIGEKIKNDSPEGDKKKLKSHQQNFATVYINTKWNKFILLLEDFGRVLAIR